MTLFRLATRTVIPGNVATAPNQTGHPITNLYYDPDTQRIVGEYDDAGFPSGTIASIAPPGKYPITNMYIDSSTGKLMGEYDDGG